MLRQELMFADRNEGGTNMLRVSMMYPVTDRATFHFEYYKTTHMGDIVKRTPGVVRHEIDEAIDGPYFMIGQIYFKSTEALEAAKLVPGALCSPPDAPCGQAPAFSLQIAR